MFRFPKSFAICCVAWTVAGSLGLAQETNRSATAAAPAAEKAPAKPKKAADPQALPDAKHHGNSAAAPTKPASGDAQSKTKAKNEPAATAAPTPATTSNQMTGAVAQGSGASSPSTVPKAAKPAPAQAGAKPAPTCAIEEPEQPRGGRLDLIGSGFGQSPVVRIAGKPARMIERREDRLVVQVPVDSNGGPVTVQAQGQSQACGSLVIIGKNR